MNQRAHDCQLPADCDGCRKYTCACCLQVKPWSDGAADEYQDLCDNCAVFVAAFVAARVATLEARSTRLESTLPTLAKSAAMARRNMLIIFGWLTVAALYGVVHAWPARNLPDALSVILFGAYTFSWWKRWLP